MFLQISQLETLSTHLQKMIALENKPQTRKNSEILNVMNNHTVSIMELTNIYSSDKETTIGNLDEFLEKEKLCLKTGKSNAKLLLEYLIKEAIPI